MRPFTALLLSLSLTTMTSPVLADKPPSKPDSKKEDTLDELMNGATPKDRNKTTTDEKKPPAAEGKPAADDGKPAAEGKPPAEGKPAAEGKSTPENKPAATGNAVVASKPATARPAAPVAAPVTDDNDSSEEAAPPVKLEPIRPQAKPRAAGPYELGPLDCRILDGAGIERILGKRLIAGEEPDLLCRVLVTQPATVASAPHELVLTVTLNEKVRFQQTRQVRVSAIGRRAIVFVVPADKIATEDAARISVRVMLSAPAKPSTREVKFVVENED